MLDNAFKRAAAFIIRKPFLDKPTIVPVDQVKQYLLLDNPRMKMAPHFPIRLSFTLRMNDFQRPCLVRGFESNPAHRVYRSFKTEFEGSYQESSAASQAILSIDYKEITKKRNFGVMLYPRIDCFEDPVFMAFGMSGHYGPDGQLNVEKIILPIFDEAGRVTDSGKVPVNPDNLELGLTFARICAEQIYSKVPMTIAQNYKKAESLIRKENAPAPELAL